MPTPPPTKRAFPQFVSKPLPRGPIMSSLEEGSRLPKYSVPLPIMRKTKTSVPFSLSAMAMLIGLRRRVAPCVASSANWPGRARAERRGASTTSMRWSLLSAKFSKTTVVSRSISYMLNLDINLPKIRFKKLSSEVKWKTRSRKERFSLMASAGQNSWQQ